MKTFACLLMLALTYACHGQGTTAGGGGVTGGASGTMNAGNVTLVSIAVTSAQPTQNVGQTLGFRATGTLSSGPTIDLTKYAKWSSSNEVIAKPIVQQPSDSVQNVGCGTPGVVQITATYGGISGSTALTCIAVLPPTPTPVSLAIAPTSPTIPQGQAGGVKYTATETYSDGSTQPVTASAVWSSSDSTKVLKVGLIAGTPATEEFDCVGTGSATVSATNDGLSAATTTQTCSAVLSSITVTPASPSVLAGNTFQFIATCTFTDGSSQACASPTWSSSSTATASISATGLATTVTAGTSTIKAQLGSISGTTVLTVTAQGPPPPTLSSITVTPSSKTVNVGSSLTITATGNYSDGSTQSVTAASAWTTSNSAVGALQLADAVVGQSYNQTLTGTGSTPYTWTEPALTSSGQIDMLDFATMPLPTRNTTHLVGTSLYKAFHVDGGLLWWIKNSAGNPWDGEAYDGKFFYHWFTEDGDSVDQPACIAAGYTSCFLDPFAYKMFVTPVPVAPRYFTLGGPDVVIKSPSPNNFVRTTNCGADNQPLINLGNIMGITHDAGNVNWGGSVGTQRTIEIQYYWGIANETTVPPTSGTRERYELAQGFGQVQWDTSTWNGSAWVVNQTSTQVTTAAGGAPTPNFGCKVPTIPLSGGLPPGSLSTAHPQLNLADNTGVISGTPNTAGTYNFTVQQEDAGGAFHISNQTINVNATATTATQTVQCLSAGTATITATDGSVSGNTSITCQNPTPTLSSIAVAPSAPTQFNGSSTQFTATGTYSDGSTQPLTSTAVWTSSNSAVATISTNIAKCVASSGTSTITATVGAVSGTATLTCTAPTTGTTGNAYCTTGGTWIGPTTDGPASLPTACMNTALSNTPSPGTTRGPDSLTTTVQADINAAACGDTILVTAGSTLGTINLPHKGCDSAHWITIKSTGVSNGLFPPEGTRATPCIAGVASLPNRPAYSCPTPTDLVFTVVAPASGSAITATGGGDHYRIIGAEITRPTTGGIAIFQLVDLSSSGTMANNIIFDRSWIHGVEGTFPSGSTTTDTSTTRGIYLGQSNHVAVVDSYFSNFYDTSSRSANGNTDAQCMAGGFGGVANSGWGVYKFVNNHCEASGEGLLMGGAGGPALTPSGCTILVNCNVDTVTDLEVRQNYFFKPPQWNGNTNTPGGAGWPVVKNGFEMKTGVRGLFEGNVIENCWYNAQVCYTFSVAPVNQQSGSGQPTCPTCAISDFTYRYNYSYNVAYGIAVYAFIPAGCPGCSSQGANRVSIHDNVVGDNLNLGTLCSGGGLCGAGDSMELLTVNDPTGKGLNKLQNVNISHNTFVKAVRSLTIFGDATVNGQYANLTMQNNIWPSGNFGIVTAGTTGGCATVNNGNFLNMLNACSTNLWTVDHNAVINWNTANLGTTLGRNWPTNGSGAGNSFFIGTSGVLFVNYGTGDSSFNPGNYALQASSPLHNAGSDGKDLGADTVTLLQKIAGVRQ